MRLPKRNENHIRETAAFKIFERIIPNEWIIREVTERDYGIDCYLELCEAGFVSGKLLTVQLKSSESISLRENNNFVVYYDINSSTVNYWNQIPVPVLFIYIDIEKELPYYLNIKQMVRENFENFLEENLKNLRIPAQNVLTKENCKNIIDRIYFCETNRKEYEIILTDFLTSIPKTYEFLYNHSGRDCFLPLGEDDSEDFYFVSLYEKFQFLAQKMNIKWSVDSIEKIIQEGNKKFGTGYKFYEYYIAKFVRQVSPIFLEIINIAYHIICVDEKSYWFEHNYYLWNYMKFKYYESYTDDIKKLEFY